MKLHLYLVCLLIATPLAHGQRAPDAGYILPAGSKAGTTVDVRLGGYNWTPDVEYIVSDPRVRLVPSGPPGPLLIAAPPYWFGAKGRLPSPAIPRETVAKLIIPADVPPGPIYWQAANANGVSSPVAFYVGETPDILENEDSTGAQPLVSLPATVSGRLSKNQEIDRYTFRAPHDGPITFDLQARRLGSKFLGILEVRDATGRLVADAVGTHSFDPVLTFAANAGATYTVSIRDLDFGGDRSYVYRLNVTPGPRILAAKPAAGTRGETAEMEFTLADGTDKYVSIKQSVDFPASGSSFAFRLDTPHGRTPPFTLLISDHPQLLAPPRGENKPLVLPGGFTGVLDKPAAEQRFRCVWKKSEVWSLCVRARKIGSPLDLSLSILGPPDKDGQRKEVAHNDDLPGTVDAGLDFAVPADGDYEIAVADDGGKSGTPIAVYHLEIRQAKPEFALWLATPKWSVPLGGKTDLAVKAIRSGGFKGPIAIALRGLPEGASVPLDLAIAADKSELIIPVKAAADAGTSASLVTLEGTATLGDVPVKRTAMAATAVHLITRDPDENSMPAFVVATTMTPRFKGRPVDQDTGRKVPRGSTHPAEISIERLDGFHGEISLQMAATQSYQHQGITGGEAIVPPGVETTLYPCFMPEWLESTRTSRMGIIAVAPVADPKGKTRYLVSDIAGFVTMTMEGALLKISSDEDDRELPAGVAFDVPVKIARLTKLVEPVRLELIAPKEFAGKLKSEPIAAVVGQDKVAVQVTPAATLTGPRTFTIRATALQHGKYLVMSETPVTVEFVVGVPPANQKAPDFDAAVAPILADRCIDCHGGQKPKGGLDLTKKSGAFAAGKSGPAIVAAKPGESPLWLRAEAGEMPPKKALPASEKAILKAWIESGAAWGSDPIDPFRITTSRRAGVDWWSLRPIKRPDLPSVKRADWARNPIDRFILAKLEAKGLTPSPATDAATLMRRLHFGLTGLPPTPDDIATFAAASKTADAAKEFDLRMDRLLNSPEYGERWARHWLDVVRFSESNGFEHDELRKNAWPYRDWVIGAFNRDIPYDEFASQQIAGDVLSKTEAGAIATGFLVAGGYDTVGQTQQSAAMKAVVRQDELEDIVGTIGQTFLGLTVQCARCHDHKFDPVRTEEYYRLTAAVAGVRHGERDVTLAAMPTARKAYAVLPKPPEPTHLLVRGNPGQFGPLVAPGGVASLGADFKLDGKATEADRRRALADWIASPKNPLFARVMVNRLWHYHFGVGLVDTPSDFGFNGGRPSHPELLDWLADEFVRSGYSVKHMQRLIVSSATYGQASAHRPDAAQRDADNRWLWRKSPMRLEAEAVRDAVLVVAGQLNGARGGPGYQDFKVAVRGATFTYTPVDVDDPAVFRRSIYRTWTRGGRNPLLDALDCPDPSTVSPRRTVTTTPLQALSLLNSSFILRMADRFAERLEKDAGEDPSRKIGRAYELAYGRSPTAAEVAAALPTVQMHGLPVLCRALFNSSEFLYVD